MSNRSHLTPRINLSATSLIDLISWDRDIHEPVFTCSLQSTEIKTFIEIPFIVPSFTIHTQSAERAVHQVTEAASAVAGQECRDGFVRARIQHRKIIPRFTTKKQIMTIFENK